MANKLFKDLQLEKVAFKLKMQIKMKILIS